MVDGWMDGFRWIAMGGEADGKEGKRVSWRLRVEHVK